MEEYTNRRIAKVLEEAVERLTLAKQLIDTQRETIKNQDEVIKDQREIINMLSEQVETLEGMLNG